VIWFLVKIYSLCLSDSLSLTIKRHAFNIYYRAQKIKGSVARQNCSIKLTDRWKFSFSFFTCEASEKFDYYVHRACIEHKTIVFRCLISTKLIHLFETNDSWIFFRLLIYYFSPHIKDIACTMYTMKYVVMLMKRAMWNTLLRWVTSPLFALWPFWTMVAQVNDELKL
jgi:hypothetical protein